MGKISINIDKKYSNEIRKLIGFVSQDIINFKIEDNYILLETNDKANDEMIRIKTEKLIGKFMNETKEIEEIIVFSHVSNKQYIDKEIVYNSSLVKDYGEGLISLSGIGLKLFGFFDNVFKKFALEIGAIEKRYPTLLPISTYKETGYCKTSPQYSIFCCTPKEDIEQMENIDSSLCDGNLINFINYPQYTLSPAACFHSYMEMEDSILQTPTVLTFNQNVFRNEGRFNWNDFGRLKDYHIREIVFIGDIEYVINLRKLIAAKTKELIEELDLNGRVCITFDPFIIPAMQKFKKIQIQEQSKYEMQLSYSNDDYLAVASFNLHGTAFTDPFNIKLNNCKEPVTGCIGYGIERWVLAFLSQYGFDMESWPNRIKQFISKEDII